jgi:hypothetical protein
LEVNNLSLYEEKALLYAEKYGIIDYIIQGFKMVWVEKFYNEGTFTHVLNLDTYDEIVQKTEKAWWE